jgi:hypothetical protein
LDFSPFFGSANKRGNTGGKRTRQTKKGKSPIIESSSGGEPFRKIDNWTPPLFLPTRVWGWFFVLKMGTGVFSRPMHARAYGHSTRLDCVKQSEKSRAKTQRGQISREINLLAPWRLCEK